MYKISKRVLDVILASSALLILSPLLLLVALAVGMQLGRPVLYRQERPGKGGRPFKLVKFRSMLEVFDSNGAALPNADRITAFGMFLRSSSLDELPELWNILKGDMSLVGPRPLLMEYLPLYDDEQRRRHDVKPGLTGWSQVNGRNAISWDEKFELDVWYVDNASLLLDIKIIYRTIGKVLRRDGITHAGDAAMPRFTGSESRTR